jgi:hypothetical protein
MYANSSAGIPVGPYFSTDGNGFQTNAFAQSGTLGYSRVLSPSTLLELHAGIVRWNADVAPLGIGFATASAVGIPNINYSPQSGGLPAVTLSSFAVMGDGSSNPETSHITTFQYDGDLIHTRGGHTIKAGALFLRHRFNGFSAFPVRGTFDFNGQYTRLNNATVINATQLPYYALADFAIGATDAANRSILSGSFGMRTYQFAPYIQDTWRISDRLTVDYGLRWDISAPPYEVHDHWATSISRRGCYRLQVSMVTVAVSAISTTRRWHRDSG